MAWPSIEAGGQGPPERVLVRGSSGPRVSSRSTNSWRAASSSRTRSSSAFSRASTAASSVAETFTPLSIRRAWAASVRPVGVSGTRASSANASAASPRSIRIRARASVACLMARLELERLAQGGLVAGGHQRVRLAQGGEQLLDERGDLGFGQGADELVGHLAVLDGEDGRDRLHAEGLGDARVVVHVDFGQFNGAIGGGHGPFEHGSERRAGTAPGGPEVHDDRELRRCGPAHLSERCRR